MPPHNVVLSLIGGAAVEGLDLKAAEATVEGVEPDAEALTALSEQAQAVKAAADKLAADAVAAAHEPPRMVISSLPFSGEEWSKVRPHGGPFRVSRSHAPPAAIQAHDQGRLPP